ncbi:MAG: GvpL/GvpF family gas vesicle protein [Candidatus Dormibacteraeota bacterium]|nr:GvpL/GvpF family gas vesicle protein [Candidatus Dormibacteraeota bacterium]
MLSESDQLSNDRHGLRAPATAADDAVDRRGCYVYGIVSSAATLLPDTIGVLGPQGTGRVDLVPHKGVAALVSDVEVGPALASPGNLVAHQRLLDGLAARLPVLPLRFGTVLADQDAVAAGLLARGYQSFLDALGRLTGRAQYLVKGRYVQDTVLREVLAENPEAVWLDDEIRSIADVDASRGLRIRLGEVVSVAIAAKRVADTRVLGDVLSPVCLASSVRDVGHPEDLVTVAVLVETARQADLERIVGQAAHEWEGRVNLRLLGPMAAYDFAQAAVTGGSGWDSWG